MEVSEIILSIDQEIARLKQVRAILSVRQLRQPIAMSGGSSRGKSALSAKTLASALQKRKESDGRHKRAARTSKSGTKLVADRGWRAISASICLRAAKRDDASFSVLNGSVVSNFKEVCLPKSAE
jgi:hypothetical protein